MADHRSARPVQRAERLNDDTRLSFDPEVGISGLVGCAVAEKVEGKRMGSLAEQRVLVTGASSGLGMRTAARLAEAGYAVVASMRTPAKSDALRAELDRRETTAEVLQLDVTSPESVTNAMAHLEATGGLDVLINNAGVQGQGFLEHLDDDTFKRVFETNFFGLVRTTRAALPLLRKSPKARVINLSSLGGLAGYPAGTAYSSSKWAVEGFSESLYYELLHFGIQVGVVEPGGYKIEMRSRRQCLCTIAGSARQVISVRVAPRPRGFWPTPFLIWCAIRRRHFGRARVMMYAGFIDCGACCRFPFSARCSGARLLLILRE
jgi:NAD(P)-dependent dehydrogenase (short-subunit alcohol dehydrogenase family)